MKSCLPKGTKYVAVFVLAAWTALSVGCTKVDDTMGAGFVPADQRMSTRVSTIEMAKGVRTYLGQMDSVSSTDMGIIFFGSKHSDIFGNTTCSAIFQPVTHYYQKDSYFGTNPVVDSVYLYMGLSGVSGNTATEQAFTIYGVTKDIARYTSYYPSFDATTVCDMANPLFKFKFSGTTSMAAKLTVTPAGKAYIDRLVAADVQFKYDTVFLEQFKGLYIIPDQTLNAAIYRGGLDFNKYASNLSLYFHNYQKDTPTQVKDTLVMRYILSDMSSTDPSYGYYYYSISINCIKRDYPQPIRDAIANKTYVAQGYLEGLDGVYTNLEFTNELIAQIDALRTKPSGGKYNMAINNATIYFEVPYANDPSLLDASFVRLGMFLDYARLSKPIPDYNYLYESAYKTSLPYGGYLNRAGGYYSMNITSLVQKMLADPTYQRTISLTPDVSYIYNFAQTTIRGSETPGYKFKMKLTYTLIP